MKTYWSSLSKDKLLFLALGLILGIGGGCFGAFAVYQPMIKDYSNQVDSLTLEITTLNLTVSVLEDEILYVSDTKTLLETKISDLESRISSLYLRVNIWYGDITVEQSKELIETLDSLVVLDVRTISEFNTKHIKGAINIPVDELEGRLVELEGSGEILVYCKSGGRSSRAMNILFDEGFSMVYNMLGGIEDWIQTGHSVYCVPCGG